MMMMNESERAPGAASSGTTLMQRIGWYVLGIAIGLVILGMVRQGRAIRARQMQAQQQQQQQAPGP